MRSWLERLKGWRTFALFSPPALLGLLQDLQVIDLAPLLAAVGVPEPSRAAIITTMAILACVLRWITTTPPAGRGA